MSNNKNEWMKQPLSSTDTARADTGTSKPFGRKKQSRPFKYKSFDVYDNHGTWSVFDDHGASNGYDHIVDDED